MEIEKVCRSRKLMVSYAKKITTSENTRNIKLYVIYSNVWKCKGRLEHRLEKNIEIIIKTGKKLLQSNQCTKIT